VFLKFPRAAAHVHVPQHIVGDPPDEAHDGGVPRSGSSSIRSPRRRPPTPLADTGLRDSTEKPSSEDKSLERETGLEPATLCLGSAIGPARRSRFTSPTSFHSESGNLANNLATRCHVDTTTS
jgi:hypothetical protein